MQEVANMSYDLGASGMMEFQKFKMMLMEHRILSPYFLYLINPNQSFR